jgi:dTMP kinase
MFVVFEGIDGSGKTTVSNRVAERLRADGLRVEHVREGGRFASAVTQGIREFCRDTRNLALGPRAEFLLYAARDVQLLEEALEPALSRADVVVADRFLYSAEVLARFGRGLPESNVRPVLEAAADGVEPDLVFLIDVDPSVARGRRKITKILTGDTRPPSRKGLTGSGMQVRLRNGYRELAARDPQRWIVVDNNDQDLAVVINHILAIVRTARAQGVAAAVAHAHLTGLRSPTAPASAATPKDALAAFLEWVDHRAVREPQLAAYVLAGLSGHDIDDRRIALAQSAPHVIARGLRGLSDAVSWDLRRRLCDTAPQGVALSLEEEAAEATEAWRLRAVLADLVPIEVALSLEGLDDDEAWAMRAQLYPQAPDAVMASLALLDVPRAWAMRERWLAERNLDTDIVWPAAYELSRVVARSITGLDGDRAWSLRKAARAAAPVAAIVSLKGLHSDRAWRWRERYLARAPKPVFATLAGFDDMRAWTMRQALVARCREALDGIIGMDHPIAWEIREASLDAWPSTVVKSLGVLVSGTRGDDMLRRAVAAHPENISLLKHSAAIATGGHLTPHVMAA